MLLLCVSIIALLATFAGYSLSDVHNTYDFLAPVIGIAQFIFIFALFKGKLWGLISYTIASLGLLVAILIYSVSKGEAGQWLVPIVFCLILLILAVDLWTQKRNFFK